MAHHLTLVTAPWFKISRYCSLRWRTQCKIMDEELSYIVERYLMWVCNHLSLKHFLESWGNIPIRLCFEIQYPQVITVSPFCLRGGSGRKERLKLDHEVAVLNCFALIRYQSHLKHHATEWIHVGYLTSVYRPVYRLWSFSLEHCKSKNGDKETLLVPLIN